MNQKLTQKYLMKDILLGKTLIDGLESAIMSSLEKEVDGNEGLNRADPSKNKYVFRFGANSFRRR